MPRGAGGWYFEEGTLRRRRGGRRGYLHRGFCSLPVMVPLSPKPGRPAFTVTQPAEAMSTLVARATELKARSTCVCTCVCVCV